MANQGLPVLKPQQGMGCNEVLSKSALKKKNQRANIHRERLIKNMAIKRKTYSPEEPVDARILAERYVDHFISFISFTFVSLFSLDQLLNIVFTICNCFTSAAK